MSQAGDISSTGGPVPPSVPTSFKVDSSEAYAYTAGAATSTPALNVEQILGDNGIQTVVNSTDTNVIQIRFARGSTTTSGAVTATALQFTTLSNTTVTMQILVSGYCTAGTASGQGIGGSTIATVINVAGVASLVDVPDYDVNTGAGLTGATFSVDTSGANFRIRVTGQAGQDISWTACTPGQVST